MAGLSVAYQGIAGRYAKALFELAEERKALDAVADDLQSLQAALNDSPDFAKLLTNPTASRDELVKAMEAITAKMKANELTRRFLDLLATKRRLEILPHAIEMFMTLLAQARGEVIAEISSAQPLTKPQLSQIEAALKQATGKALNLKMNENPALLGGLVIKIGGKMLDYSLAGQLERMRTALSSGGAK